MAAAFTERLARCRKVGLDTAAFRLYLAGDERYAKLTLAVFEAIERGKLQGVASVLTLDDLLTDAHKRRDEQAVQDLNVLLPTFPNLVLAPVTAAVASKSAGWQARLGLSQGAAISAATSAVEGVDALIAGDQALACLQGDMNVLILAEYL